MKSKLTKIFFGSAAFALLASQAAAEGKISGITTKPVSDGLEVQINGTGLTAPKITRVMGGRSFMLEFDANLTSDPQWIRVEQDGVHYVQSVYAQAHPSKIRIHLRVDPDTRIDVTPDAGGFLVKAESSTGTPAPAIKTKLGGKGSITMYREPQQLSVAPTIVPEQPHIETTAYSGRKVSLDFVSTDIVQILKALALEANVNIVTSPDVKGVLSVSLDSVSIKQALDLVTTMDGLKYAKVGNTYVVSSAQNINDIMEKLGGKSVQYAETRVVPIYSGQGTQIKDALRTTDTDVEILLPSEKPLSQAMVNQASEQIGGGELAAYNTGKNGAPNQAAAAAGQSTTPTNTNGGEVKDAYLVLVGPAARLNSVERQVKEVDSQMCAALGLPYTESDAMIRESYHPVGTTAGDLVGALYSTTSSAGSSGSSEVKPVFHTKVGTVELFATPMGSTSEQTVVLYGRETEVDRVMETLKSLDSLSQGDDNFVVYGVKYLDPRALREDLVAKFPGLSVNIPPASVINTSAYQAGSTLMQNEQKAGEAVGQTYQPNANANAGSQNSSGSSSSQADTGQTPGLSAPFAADEAYGVPMKLVLHGAPELIQEAESYLNAVDVQPKQVALELRVMELSKEDALNLGLNWSLLTGGTVQVVSGNEAGGTNPSTTAGGQPVLSNPGSFSSALGFAGGGKLGVTATLDQLADSNKMIARPNILAVDGRESEMFVGDDIKYIEQEQSTQNGISITTGDVEVGVKLAVLPRIGSNDDISMELRPQVSTLIGWTQVPGGGQIPETGLRIAQSTMVVHDGETIAIGGLIQDTDTKKRDGVPILKDIPILNLLFSRVNNDHQRDEVVFFLTARVVDNGSIHNAANPNHGEAPMEHEHQGGGHRHRK